MKFENVLTLNHHISTTELDENGFEYEKNLAFVGAHIIKDSLQCAINIQIFESNNVKQYDELISQELEKFFSSIGEQMLDTDVSFFNKFINE